MNSIEIHEELNKFNDIKFFDEGHKYVLKDGNHASSVTTLFKEFEPPFNKKFWAEKKAKQQGVSPQEIINLWEANGKFSREKGTLFHAYAENYIANRVFERPIGLDDKMNFALDRLEVLFHAFYEKTKNSLIPIASELVIGDEESRTCGMLDQLYFNKKHNEFQIFDWKTNKQIRTEPFNNQKLLTELNHLDNCELVKYSLQLSCYKYIIEKMTNIKIGSCFVLWFHEKNETFKHYKVHDLSEDVDKLFKKRILTVESSMVKEHEMEFI
jgi:hypothetical protein